VGELSGGLVGDERVITRFDGAGRWARSRKIPAQAKLEQGTPAS